MNPIVECRTTCHQSTCTDRLKSRPYTEDSRSKTVLAFILSATLGVTEHLALLFLSNLITSLNLCLFIEQDGSTILFPNFPNDLIPPLSNICVSLAPLRDPTFGFDCWTFIPGLSYIVSETPQLPYFHTIATFC